MRDKMTMRGRGFGFVKMAFKDEDEAKKAKEQILSQNNYHGHNILGKKVDVKSADDYQGKGAGGGMNPMMGGFGGGGVPPFMGGGNPMMNPYGKMDGMPPVAKPNPYVIAEPANRGGE